MSKKKNKNTSLSSNGKNITFGIVIGTVIGFILGVIATFFTKDIFWFGLFPMLGLIVGLTIASIMDQKNFKNNQKNNSAKKKKKSLAK